MADDGAVSQFVAVTGADAATASFYLSAAGGELDGAVSAFFESGGAPAPDPNAPPGGNDGGDDGSDPVAAVAAAPAATQPGAAAPRRTGRRPPGGVATLGSIGAGQDSDDDESGKNYYAGGEKSGQMIQDPRDRGRRGGPSGLPGRGGGGDGDAGGNGDGEGEGEGDLSEAIFERARQRGPLTDAERDEFHGPQNFTGAGYRLGNTGAGSGAGAGAGASAGAGAGLGALGAAGADGSTAPSAPDVIGRRNVTRTLTFFANGFTVDEGPLRAFDDPANAAFLEDIKRGFVPKEMEEPGVGNVSINLVDRKGEEYVPPKPVLVPFSGGGNRLGAEASTAAPTASSAPNASAAAASVSVDESRPVASIQIRLSDGSRLVARLNEDHTVQNLREFVSASRPSVPATFTLATTFPRKKLDDPSQTIKEAGLNGAVVVQSTS